MVTMPPEGSDHAFVKSTATQQFARQQPVDWHLRVESPLRLGSSEPVPDLAVVPGKPADYRHQHPTKALLVIEIADTSLEHDRTKKLALYAKAGIPEYWIINLLERVLEVYREPSGKRYKSIRYYTLDETVSPLFAPEWQIAVSSLLD
ncbi:MAG: Uma2 family endonuclease [Fimbriimonadales bacterium]|nr:Uma2 family endonuclease [Fimbriimonadales bacterium]